MCIKSLSTVHNVLCIKFVTSNTKQNYHKKDQQPTNV